MTDVDATEDGLQLNPYHAIVRRKVIASFRRLNERDPSAALALMADDVRYTFSGDHALGGTRVSRRGVEKWFGRLLRLFRSTFSLRSVRVVGWPWRTEVFNVFEDHVVPEVGESYVNRGVQVVELRWGRAVRIETWVDTARVVHLLDELAAHGVGEAHAAPICE
jgi:ketosteroid isomerase-like protein